MLIQCVCIGFDVRSEFSLPDSSCARNIIVFGLDNSSSVHVENLGEYER